MKAVIVSGINLNASEVEEHLRSLGEDFLANLKESTDISEYSLKLSTLSTINAILMNRDIAGLVAYYFNEESEEVFISHLGVVPKWRKNGFATKLILSIEQDITCSRIKLEVSRENTPAILLYQSLDFKISEIMSKSVLLERVRNGRNQEL